jgi:hypothetical protein
VANLPTPIESLIALEPLSGAALALCLAYLALERFRYRDTIQANAVEKLRDEQHTSDVVHHTTAFGTLVWLAGSAAPPACIRACEQARENGNATKDRAPSGFKATTYDWLFRIPLGEGIVAALAVIAFTVLFSGVCASAGIWTCFPTSILSVLSPTTFLMLLLAGSVFPVLLVGLGRMCMTWSKRYADDMGQELKETAEKMQQQVRQLPPPDI